MTDLESARREAKGRSWPCVDSMNVHRIETSHSRILAVLPFLSVSRLEEGIEGP